jgi:hypothetical protein
MKRDLWRIPFARDEFKEDNDEGESVDSDCEEEEEKNVSVRL